MSRPGSTYVSQPGQIPEAVQKFILAYRALCREHEMFILCEGESLEIVPGADADAGLHPFWGMDVESPSFMLDPDLQ